jgi:hypothetical protein
MSQLLLNAIKTPDGTVMISMYRHDYKVYTDKISGEEYMVDGGLDYLRRNVNTVPYEELSVHDDGTHETRRKALHWGKNFDEDGNQLPETIFQPIKDMSSDHILAILNNIRNIAPLYKETFENELIYRTSC